MYFHPEFKFKDKDGQVYFLFDDDGNVLGLSSDVVEPISYSRRSPWPIINILRTPMVTTVQKSVPEGKIFSQNVERLELLGSDVLQKMLDERDWSKLPVYSAHAKVKASKQLQQEYK